MSAWLAFLVGCTIPGLLEWAVVSYRARRGCRCTTVGCFCPKGPSARVVTLAVLLLAFVGCSRTPPAEKPKPHTIEAELHCYVVESERGGGLVCTEYASACRALQQLTEVASGVTAISQCRPASVTADAK